MSKSLKPFRAPHPSLDPALAEEMRVELGMMTPEQTHSEATRLRRLALTLLLKADGLLVDTFHEDSRITTAIVALSEPDEDLAP